ALTLPLGAPTFPFLSLFVFSNELSPPKTYTLSLHDALPISILDPRSSILDLFSRPRMGGVRAPHQPAVVLLVARFQAVQMPGARDRKSTRLNSSHVAISYAVFCLKKKIDRRVAQRFCRGFCP